MWLSTGCITRTFAPRRCAILAAFAAATREYVEAGKDLQGKGYDPRKLLAPGFDAIKKTVKEKMELFGSVNQA